MLLKNKKIIWLSFIGVSLISVIYLGLNLKPATKPQNTEPIITTTPPPLQAKKEIKINSIEVDPQLKWPTPGKMAVFEASVSSVDMLATAQKLAEGLNITRKSTTPPVWSDKDYTRYLNIDPENLQLKYQIDGYARPELYSGNSKPTLSGATVAAQTFVRIFPMWKDYQVDESSIHFTAGEAILVSISFYPTFNDNPLSYDNQTTAPLIILVGQKNTVVSFTYLPKQIVLSTTPQEAVAAEKDQILQEIVSGKILPIDSQSYELKSEDIKSLDRVTLEKAIFEYRVLKSQNKAVPFYRLTGLAKKNGVIERIFYLVPAIRF